MTHRDDPTPTHVILGAGQVGRKLAHELLDRGVEVRIVRRGEPGPSRPGLTWLRGDVLDPSFASDACRGADVVYNTANPSDYGRWEGVMEPLHEAIQDAAARAGAPLVSLDNLYMVGVPAAVPFDEDVPMQPCSAKGRMRERLVRRAFAMADRGELRVTFGRAPDFFGPRSPNSLIGDRFLERVRAGKPVEVFGDPDLPRSYAYTPDVARALAILGTNPRAFERRVWQLPVIDAPTTRALVKAFSDAAGQEPKLRAVPSWMIKMGGLVSPLARAAAEMIYQWEVPYVASDARFRETFGVAATPVADAVRATLAAHAEGEPALEVAA